MTDTSFDQLPANHFDPPKPTVPRWGWSEPKRWPITDADIASCSPPWPRVADAIAGAL